MIPNVPAAVGTGVQLFGSRPERFGCGLFDGQVVRTKQGTGGEIQGIDERRGIGPGLVGDDPPGALLLFPAGQQAVEMRKQAALFCHGLSIGIEQELASLGMLGMCDVETERQSHQGTAAIGNLRANQRVGQRLEAVMVAQGVGRTGQVGGRIDQGTIKIKQQGMGGATHTDSRRQCIM